MDRNGMDITVILRVDRRVTLPEADNDSGVPVEEQCRITPMTA